MREKIPAGMHTCLAGKSVCFDGGYVRLALAAISHSPRQTCAPAHQAIDTRCSHIRALMPGVCKTFHARQQPTLFTLIKRYRQPTQPRLAPKTLLKHYMTGFPDASRAGQRNVDSRSEARRLRYGY